MARTKLALAQRIQRRLGDTTERVWTLTQIGVYLDRAYRELAQMLGVFVDWTYLENLPAGFSGTAAWEVASEAFHYGIANYTMSDERRLLTESDRIGPANHTSPFEATDSHLADASASTAISATAELPAAVMTIQRVVWDRRTCAALLPAQLARSDVRYETIAGEVVGYTWRKDGPRTLRKYKVPASIADTYVITGSWGSLRNVDDLDAGTPTSDTWPVMFSYTQPFEAVFAGRHDVGRATFTAAWEDGLIATDQGPANHTSSFEYAALIRAGLTPTTIDASWGAPRRMAGQHPMGTTGGRGLPRRVYRDGRNVRVEHTRSGRLVSAWLDPYELPTRYADYLSDYALGRCLALDGPGQDRTLAAHYQARWARNVARVQRRLQRQDHARVNVFGGAPIRSGAPARPRYPSHYGTVVR